MGKERRLPRIRLLTNLLSAKLFIQIQKVVQDTKFWNICQYFEQKFVNVGWNHVTLTLKDPKAVKVELAAEHLQCFFVNVDTYKYKALENWP